MSKVLSTRATVDPLTLGEEIGKLLVEIGSELGSILTMFQKRQDVVGQYVGIGIATCTTVDQSESAGKGQEEESTHIGSSLTASHALISLE